VAIKLNDATTARESWQEGQSLVSQLLSNAASDAHLVALKRKIEEQISKLP
jgi:hypothetical protein